MRCFDSRTVRRKLAAGFLPVALFVVIAGPHLLWSAPPAEPRASDRAVTSAVTRALIEKHVSKRPLNDEISRRGFDLFLKFLDSQKQYFTQADVDEFTKRRDDLDDMLKKQDLRLAYAMHKRFLERLDERIALVDDLLQEKHDFTVEEEIVVDPQLSRYARDAKETRERWRKRIKLDLLDLKADKTEGQAAFDKLSRRYRTFAKRMHQTDGDDLLEMFLTAITTSYDPHTNYMSPSSFASFQIDMRLNLEGIGASLRPDDGETIVMSVVPGGAADKDGKLKPGDKIHSVGEGEAGDMVDVRDMKLDETVKLIRGKAGTKVRLGVAPAAGGEPVVYTITRARIELKDREARGVIFDDVKQEDGTNLKVGVINLPSFYRDFEGVRRGGKSSTRDVRVILDDFTAKGVDAVVLDLRKNGGGSLEESISLTGLFIDQGPVVQIKDSEGNIEMRKDVDPGQAWDGPLVVVCDKGSASASEILAGAIQDYRRGLIVGDESSHGKGTVQQLEPVDAVQRLPFVAPPNLGALKITIQQFYRPNGDSTQKRGVVADIALPSLTNHLKGLSESDNEYALNFDRVASADFGKLRLVSEELVAGLKANSVARRAKSEYFAKLLSDIERYKELRDRKTLPLNEKEYFAQRHEFDIDKEQKKLDDPANKPNDEVVKRDFYFDEVLAITAEYAKALQMSKVAKAK